MGLILKCYKTMEKNKEQNEKKEMAGKAAASVVGVAAFAGATAVGIDVLGDESVDELVAVNPVEEVTAVDVDPDQLLAYEQTAAVEDVTAAELEIIEDSKDLPEGGGDVRLSADAESQSYVPGADVHMDADMEGLLASADASDVGFMDGVIDAVNDLV